MTLVDQTGITKEGRTTLVKMNQSSIIVNAGRNVQVLWKEAERKQTELQNDCHIIRKCSENASEALIEYKLFFLFGKYSLVSCLCQALFYALRVSR